SSIQSDFTPVIEGATTDLTDIEASATLSVANFGTLQGDFGFQSYIVSGIRQIAVGATSVTATLGTSSTYLQVTNASFGMVIKPGSSGSATTYALKATASSAGLFGVTGLTLTANNLLVEAREGLDLSEASGLPVVQTSGGAVTLNFSGLGPGTG